MPGFGAGDSHVGHSQKEPHAGVVSILSLRAFTTRCRGSAPFRSRSISYAAISALPDAVAFRSESSFGAAHSTEPSWES